MKPYQPDGLWKEIATDGDYVQSKGGDLYRRSMYTYWKRTVAPPVMTAFDAPDREFCRVRRARTNTPLQALALLNDVTFVEAARVLAERAMVEGGKTPETRITHAFRLLTARKPRPIELRILTLGFRAHLVTYGKNRKAAEKLVSLGEAKRRKGLDAAELAAYTATTSLMLNLDEVMTKESAVIPPSRPNAARAPSIPDAVLHPSSRHARAAIAAAALRLGHRVGSRSLPGRNVSATGRLRRAGHRRPANDAETSRSTPAGWRGH